MRTISEHYPQRGSYTCSPSGPAAGSQWRYVVRQERHEAAVHACSLDAVCSLVKSEGDKRQAHGSEGRSRRHE